MKGCLRELRWAPLSLAVIAATGLLLSGCGRPTEADAGMPPEVLAVVGKREIRRSDLEQELAGRGPGASPDAVLEEMIRFESSLSEARRLGIEAEPETRKAIERMLVSRLEERQRAEIPTSVSDEEISALYEAEPERHTVPAAVRGGVLRLAISPKADEPSRRRKAELAAELRSRAASLDDPGFHALVREHSDDAATRYNRGDTGWITATDDGSLPAPAAAALRSLRGTGAVSQVVETTNGFHVVRLYASRPERSRPLHEVADGLRHRILLAKAAERERERFRRLRDAVVVRTNSAALAQLVSRRAALPSNPSSLRPPSP